MSNGFRRPTPRSDTRIFFESLELLYACHPQLYVCMYIPAEARPYIKRACHIDGNLTSNINKMCDGEGVGRFETLPSWHGAVLIG